MTSRPLTSGEIALAQQIFGNTINYSNVLIHDEKWIVGQGDNTVMTPGGEIYYPPGLHDEDFSTATNSLKALFIHEMSHVLQHQNGMNVKLKAILGGGNYDYDAIFHGTPFHKLPMEAQAEFLEDYFRKLNGIAIDPDKPGGTLEDPGRDISEYEAVMPVDLPGAAPGNGSLDDLVGPPVPAVEPYGPWIPQTTVPFGQGEQQGTPIVLDVDASGTIELAALYGTGSVMWDIDQDDFVEASGWITGGDGLLCIDLNSDGIINDHGELFGGTNGYVTLAGYDTNSSSTITSADADFGDLRVWIDSNADGYSQAAELHTLSSLGITSISTAYSTVNYAIAGNDIKFESTFVMNGNTYTSVDAFFAYDGVNTEYVGDYTLDDRVLFLPTLRGYGDLPDLHIAMSMDEDLLEMVQDFVALDFQEKMEAAFDSTGGATQDILFRWASVDEVDPTSRGSYIDARALAFLEEFMGREWGGGGNPGINQAAFVMQAFGAALNAFALRLAYQTTDLDDVFDGNISYNPVTDTFAVTSAVNLEAADEFMSAADGWAQKFNAARLLVCLIEETVGVSNLSGGDYDDLAALMPSNTTIEAFLNPFAGGTATVSGDSLDNVIVGSDLNDTLNGNGGHDTLIGGAGLDYLVGGTGDDTYVLSAGLGVDTIEENTGAGTDTIVLAGYDPGDVRLWTSTAGNLIITSKADDADTATIIGATTGASGTFYETDIASYVEQIVFDDTTTLDLTAGLTLEGSSSSENLYGSQFNDQLNGMGDADGLYGNRGNDTLYGGAGNDDLDGGAGNDVLDGGADNDTLVGGSGTDTLSYGTAASAVTVNLATITGQNTVGAGTDTASGFENLTGSGYNDTLTGNSSANTIRGGAGNDTISGANGNDILYGSAGTDTLTGGSNADTFVFELASAFSNQDTITDFNTGQSDKIDLHDVIDLEFDPVTEAISDFVNFTNSGANSIMQIDRDGTGSTYGWANVATLNGVTNLDETTLYNNGHILAA